MTSLLPPAPMHTSSTIRFRDPFVSKDTAYPHSHFSYEYSRPAASSLSSSQQQSVGHRVLTPPPEMNGTAASVRPSQYQEHGQYLANYGQSQVAPYQSYGHTATTNTSTTSRTMSPTSRPSTVGPADAVSTRQSSQSNAIAPSLQIPRAVNNSQGSLSELAAQVCVKRQLLPSRHGTD